MGPDYFVSNCVDIFDIVNKISFWKCITLSDKYMHMKNKQLLI